MWKDNVTLIAALIAASTSTGNAVLSSRSATSLESKKWEQARLDQAAANLRLAVADFAKELATASERAMWLTWTAENDSEGLSERELRAYEEDIRVVMPKLFSAQTL